jgi:hypothetical protein
MKQINFYHSILPPQYTSDSIHINTKKNLDKWVYLNPEIIVNQNIYTNDDCRNFLKDFSISFGKDILKWFDYEMDGRYKSDIWRLCVLYEYGGVYVDIDQEPLVSLDQYLDFDRVDFCAAANMGQHNVSNGFIYAKKSSNIIKHNIDEMINVYENDKPKGGTHVMGSVITKLTNGEPLKIPIGEFRIGDENCLLLHEIGDESLENIDILKFLHSFGLYSNNDTLRVMNSRYSTYYRDKHETQKFIKI